MVIKHPEWLQLAGENNTILYGYDQDWYPTSFQRTRGCGPMTAAMLLSYVSRREGSCLPYGRQSLAELVQQLEDVWRFVTPSRWLGLNSTQKFCNGVTKLVRHYRLPWSCRRLGVKLIKSQRPSLDKVVEFLEQGLSADCPVAFLNLHKGREMTLESWHWITIIGLSYDEQQARYQAVCYDNGQQLSFDLGLWLNTSRLGGGFVYVCTPSVGK